MQEQSIYNLIPKEDNPQVRQPLYQSKHPYNTPPTGSTFCHHTTSLPQVSNLSGSFTPLQPLGLMSTFGKLSNRSSPHQFRRRSTLASTLPPIRLFSYDCRHKKPLLPKDIPKHGLNSNSNYIVANAVSTILSTPKTKLKQVDWLKKEDFGKTPSYLHQIKDSIRKEYTMFAELHKQPQQNLLQEQQIIQLREGLKKKWIEVNSQYQMITHVRVVDTLGLKNKKLHFQQELMQLEKDIKRLNKKYILIQ